MSKSCQSSGSDRTYLSIGEDITYCTIMSAITNVTGCD